MVRTEWLIVLAACGAPPNAAPVAPSPPGDVSCPNRVGDPALYTLGTSDSIAAPQTCAAMHPDEAFIRVAGTGTLPFSVSRPGEASGCTAPGASCETVDLGSFLLAVRAKLQARGVDPVSTHGMGECGKTGDGVGWEDRHMSITVYDWKHANDAVAILDEEQRTWNVAQPYEVSVERVKCTTLSAR